MSERFESLVSRKLPVSIFGFWFCVIIVTKPQYEIYEVLPPPGKRPRKTINLINFMTPTGVFEFQ